MKNKKTRQHRNDSPVVVRVLPIQNPVSNEVSDKEVTREPDMAENNRTKTKSGNNKKVDQKRATNMLLCADTVRLAEVIALFVNPAMYVTFSVAYFFIGRLG